MGKVTINGDFPSFFVCLPEGKTFTTTQCPNAPTPLCSKALIKAFAKIVQGVDIVPELIQGGPRQLG